MKQTTRHTIAKIDDTGIMYMPDRNELFRWFEDFPGMNVSVTFEIMTPKSSKEIQTYYNKSIVPQFQQAFMDVHFERLTLSDVDERLRRMAPCMRIELSEEETGGFALEGLHTIYSVDNARASEFLETLRQVGAEKFYIDVKNPLKE